MTTLILTDYNITIKSLRPFMYECLLVHKNGGTTFGIIVSNPTPPTPEGVFHVFITQPKHFFIEAEVIITVAPPIIPLPAPSNP